MRWFVAYQRTRLDVGVGDIDHTTRSDGHSRLSPAIINRNNLVSQFLWHSFTDGYESLFGDFAKGEVFYK